MSKPSVDPPAAGRTGPLAPKPIPGPAPAASRDAARPPSLFQQLLWSSWVSPRTPLVRSWSFAAVCAVLVAVSLATFDLLSNGIAKAASEGGFSTADPEDPVLVILDRRFGYTPSEVTTAMKAWGPRGRILYVAIEAVDVLIYMTAYRGLFVALFNRLASLAATVVAAASGGGGRSGGGVARATAWLLHHVAVPWPVILSYIDVLEDAFQLSVVAWYHYQWELPALVPGAVAGSVDSKVAAWRVLVNAASVVNMIKWMTVYSGLGLTGLTLLGLAVGWMQGWRGSRGAAGGGGQGLKRE
ncbi:hypothetical protein HYH02_009050 [Chlamydomonas schloesseri]|uniref:Uncharacterized protein n=1 Tax=Chlamydomonas schloesseri TaxID=2026947 RepID=A0A835WB19_9CHLO|nr:hypothetical protein HYH02_009050 [Chlamydomonas schloesseri]|eukprot:KAG2444108.1 hypothetical protein HYH02_009050 [Chlamydomonas schloesseri]